MGETKGKVKKVARINKFYATEAQDRIALVSWAWLVHKVTLVYYPVELMRFLNDGQKIFYRKSGTRIHWPDFTLYEARCGYHGLVMELKREKGGVLDQGQISWLDYLKDRGYYTTVCKGFEEAKSVIEWYLMDKKI